MIKIICENKLYDYSIDQEVDCTETAKYFLKFTFIVTKQTIEKFLCIKCSKLYPERYQLLIDERLNILK